MTCNISELVGSSITLFALISCQFFIQRKSRWFAFIIASTVFNSQFLIQHQLVQTDHPWQKKYSLSNFRCLPSVLRKVIQTKGISKINCSFKTFHQVNKNNHNFQPRSIPFQVTNDIKILVKYSKYQSQSWQNGNRCWYGRFYTRISLG
jgi:hypothetical protein